MRIWLSAVVAAAVLALAAPTLVQAAKQENLPSIDISADDCDFFLDALCDVL